MNKILPYLCLTLAILWICQFSLPLQAQDLQADSVEVSEKPALPATLQKEEKEKEQQEDDFFIVYLCIGSMMTLLLILKMRRWRMEDELNR